MMFTQKFDKYATCGDFITCEVGNITYIATLVHDDDSRPTEDEGYDAKSIKDWHDNEWSYVGVVVTARCCDIELIDTYRCSLWGCEMNLNGSNEHLHEVANDVLPDAKELAHAKLFELAHVVAKIAMGVAA